jgi:hypothetical protein
MATGKMENGVYWARCEVCGRWRQVEPAPLKAEPFFAHFQALFTCCGHRQRAGFTVEKDELDFH